MGDLQRLEVAHLSSTCMVPSSRPSSFSQDGRFCRSGIDLLVRMGVFEEELTPAEPSILA